MRGRKPIPSHLKLVAGNPGRRPLNPDEPRPRLLMPSVPAHLSDEAKVEWGRVSNELHECGLLSRIDRAVLAVYCQAWADAADAKAKLDQYGKVIRSPSKTITRRARNGTETTETTGGYLMQSPYLSIYNRAVETMMRAAAEFGMTPSSRSRVTANKEPAKDDPAKKYLG